MKKLTLVAAISLALAEIAPAATFTVTNTNDSGPGSLRQAIVEANAAPGADRIAFNLPGPGVHTIGPLSALPALTDDGGVTIDGYTQPGTSPNTLAVGDNAVLLIELRGMGKSTGPGVNGLLVQSSRNTIRGLVVNRFDRGIWIQSGSENEVAGCFIGTDAAGTTALPNRYGVIVGSSTESSVEGARIGGSDPASRNVVSGNTQAGVGIEFSASRCFVLGNLIGTDASGLAAVPNGLGIGVQAFFIHVGGRTPGAGNVVSGNQDAGIVVAFSADTTIEGNLVGTTAAGNAALSNRHGIQCFTDFRTLIGGPDPGAGNVISGNSMDGVLIFANSANDAVVRNRIGTDATGQTPLGNGRNGVTIRSSSHGNVVGGGTVDSENVIAFNGSAGVAIGLDANDPARGNSVLRNSIHDNGALAIDLGSNGVTPNDPGDGDTGPNGLQNFPVLTSAVATGEGITVFGTLESRPVALFTIELFASPTCDPAGFGEGRSFLGAVTVTTDGGGRVAFQTSVPSPPGSAGSFLTATATDSEGNTSEFSACLGAGVTPSAPIPVGFPALAALGLFLALLGGLLSRGSPASP